MIRNLLLCIFIVCSYLGGAQNIKDLCLIRDFKQDLILIEKKGEIDHFNFSPYGKFVFNYSNNEQIRYLFQGQEYSPELNLYLYSSRIYSPANFRFNQPDPKSQYFSPYLFVGADPVNFIDFTGNTGKPLVLFGEDYDHAKNIDKVTEDVLDELPDSYQMSFQKFMNGEVGDLPEWNGNVFMISHSGQERHEEIEMVRGKDLSKVKKMNGAVMDTGGEIPSISIDGAEVGRRLRFLSEERGVPVKNIVSGGCQGSVASRRVGLGFAELKKPQMVGKGASVRAVKRKLYTFGAKKGRYTYFIGPKEGSYDNVLGPKRTQMFLTDGSEGDQLHANLDIVEGEPSRIKSYYRKDEATKADVDYDYIEGEQLSDLANGRIPSNIMKDMHRGLVLY